jgi:2-oxoglutarate ferredoxin oxidoreductase subunit alpha
MAKAGEGYRAEVTGLTHDEHGYPAMNWQAQQKLVSRLVGKIRDNVNRIARWEEKELEDADVAVVAYGITSRVAERAMQMARAEGLKVGLLRPVVVWPFPEKRIRELAAQVRTFVVVEMNYGQMVYEVERCAGDQARTVLLGHGGGAVHEPEQILKAIREAAQ